LLPAGDPERASARGERRHARPGRGRRRRPHLRDRRRGAGIRRGDRAARDGPADHPGPRRRTRGIARGLERPIGHDRRRPDPDDGGRRRGSSAVTARRIANALCVLYGVLFITRMALAISTGSLNDQSGVWFNLLSAILLSLFPLLFLAVGYAIVTR